MSQINLHKFCDEKCTWCASREDCQLLVWRRAKSLGRSFCLPLPQWRGKALPLWSYHSDGKGKVPKKREKLMTIVFKGGGGGLGCHQVFRNIFCLRRSVRSGSHINPNVVGAVSKWCHHSWKVHPDRHVIFQLNPQLVSVNGEKIALRQNSLHQVAYDYLFSSNAL